MAAGQFKVKAQIFCGPSTGNLHISGVSTCLFACLCLSNLAHNPQGVVGNCRTSQVIGQFRAQCFRDSIAFVSVFLRSPKMGNKLYVGNLP